MRNVLGNGGDSGLHQMYRRNRIRPVHHQPDFIGLPEAVIGLPFTAGDFTREVFFSAPFRDCPTLAAHFQQGS
jgi:hypothetical protein